MAIISGAQCDVCGNISYFPTHSGKGDTIEHFRRNGWSVTKRTGDVERVICPSCKAKKGGKGREEKNRY